MKQEIGAGNNNDLRGRVRPAGVGWGPPLYPNRLAVALAPQSENNTVRVRPATDGLERFSQAALGIGSVGSECFSVGPLDFLGFDPQNSHGRAVGANKTRVETFMDIRNGGFIEEIA